MRAIVLVDKNWGIGHAGEQILYLKGDLARFVRLTKGHVVIYGRKTMQTFPKAGPLPQRKNILLSRSLDSAAELGDQVQLVRSIEGLNCELDILRQEGYLNEEFFVLGGASIYTQLLPYFTRVDVTMVQAEFPADKYFPNLELSSDFVLDQRSRRFSGQTDSGMEVSYEYRSYRRVRSG